jgi:hypothetical protein
MVKRIADWQHDIQKERSLWEILVASSKFRPNRFNVSVVVIVFFSVLISIVIDIIMAENASDIAKQCAESAKEVNEFGFDFVVQVLGFLIAGFTIFATIGRPDLFMKLAMVEHNENKVSHFKVIFYYFMRTFILFCVYIGFNFAFTVVYHFLETHSGVGRFVGTAPIQVRNFISVSVYMFSVFFVVILIVQLKSFIWNVFATIRIYIIYANMKGRIQQDNERKS